MISRIKIGALAMSKLQTRNYGRRIDGLAIWQPFIPAVLMCSVQTIGNWYERQSQRRALAPLEDYRLKDIGLSREQARREAAKPFWKR
jgi:uncharacterized protein YjiS (DUF1127 family)